MAGPLRFGQQAAPEPTSWWDRNAGWVFGGAALLGSGISTALGVREAAKNRKFQKEMSDTEHQRSVEDLRKAGLNPALAAMSGGASTPSGSVGDVGDFGEGVSKALASALQVKAAKAQIGLTEAQRDREYASAGLLLTQNEEQRGLLGMQANKMRIDTSLAELNLAERRNLFAPVIAQAYASIDSMTSAAQAARARAALDEFAQQGAMNEADVQKLIARMPEWVRLFGSALKFGAGAAGGAIAGAALRGKPSPKTVIINRRR